MIINAELVAKALREEFRAIGIDIDSEVRDYDDESQELYIRINNREIWINPNGNIDGGYYL